MITLPRFKLFRREAGDYPSAQKFAQKSINLFSTPEALKLLEIIKVETDSSKPSASTSKASGRETHSTASTTHSRTAASSASDSSSTKKAVYTEAQVKLVRRVRNCKITDYYEILELEKSCEEADVKKAYRKVGILWRYLPGYCL